MFPRFFHFVLPLPMRSRKTYPALLAWLVIISCILLTTHSVLSAPRIDGILGDPLTGSDSDQNIIINGSGFTENTIVRLADRTNGCGGSCWDDKQPESISSSGNWLTIRATLTIQPALWSVKAGDGTSWSEPVFFSVNTPNRTFTPPTRIYLEDMDEATSFRMPIGSRLNHNGEDVGDDLSRLFVGEFPNGYPKIWFNHNGENDRRADPNEWYVKTAFNQNTNVENWLGEGTQVYWDQPEYQPTWRHPGEDWNLTTGGADDHNAAIYSIADGVVLYSSGENLETWWYGKTVIVVHKLSSGVPIASLYGHLDAIESGISSGVTVSKGDILGRIGDTGTGKDAYHLHFEIWQASMLRLQLVPEVKTRISPAHHIGMWPASSRAIKYDSDNLLAEDDGGKDFIATHYLDPSKFLHDMYNADLWDTSAGHATPIGGEPNQEKDDTSLVIPTSGVQTGGETTIPIADQDGSFVLISVAQAAEMATELVIELSEPDIPQAEIDSGIRELVVLPPEVVTNAIAEAPNLPPVVRDQILGTTISDDGTIIVAQPNTPPPTAGGDSGDSNPGIIPDTTSDHIKFYLPMYYEIRFTVGPLSDVSTDIQRNMAQKVAEKIPVGARWENIGTSPVPGSATEGEVMSLEEFEARINDPNRELVAVPEPESPKIWSVKYEFVDEGRRLIRIVGTFSESDVNSVKSRLDSWVTSRGINQAEGSRTSPHPYDQSEYVTESEFKEQVLAWWNEPPPEYGLYPTIIISGGTTKITTSPTRYYDEKYGWGDDPKGGTFSHPNGKDTDYTRINRTSEPVVVQITRGMSRPGLGPQISYYTVTVMPEKPAPPEELAAITQSSSEILLTWQGASSASEYVVERGVGDGFQEVAVTAETSYKDTDLLPDTSYEYRVFSKNITGLSDSFVAANVLTDEVETISTTDPKPETITFDFETYNGNVFTDTTGTLDLTIHKIMLVGEGKYGESPHFHNHMPERHNWGECNVGAKGNIWSIGFYAFYDGGGAVSLVGMDAIGGSRNGVALVWGPPPTVEIHDTSEYIGIRVVIDGAETWHRVHLGPPSTWYQIILTKDGDAHRVIVDGIERLTFTAKMPPLSGVLSLGYVDGIETLHGRIDDLFVMDRVVTVSEIAAHRDGGVEGLSATPTGALPSVETPDSPISAETAMDAANAMPPIMFSYETHNPGYYKGGSVFPDITGRFELTIHKIMLVGEGKYGVCPHFHNHMPERHNWGECNVGAKGDTWSMGFYGFYDGGPMVSLAGMDAIGGRNNSVSMVWGPPATAEIPDTSESVGIRVIVDGSETWHRAHVGPPATWYQMVLIKEGNVFRVVIDGVERTTFTANMPSLEGILSIAYVDGVETLHGRIDDLFVADRVVTDSEIQAHKSGGIERMSEASNGQEDISPDTSFSQTGLTHVLLYTRVIGGKRQVVAVPKDKLLGEVRILTDPSHSYSGGPLSPLGDNLATSTGRYGGWKASIIDLTTGEETVLTNTDGVEASSPRWLDNRYVVIFYDRHPTLGGEVCVYDSDNPGEFVNITNSPNREKFVSISPSGKIAFSSLEGNNWNIFVVNKDGSNKERITTRGDRDLDPCWVDEENIIFEGQGYSLWTVNVITKEVQPLPMQGYDPCVSDDGMLAIARDRDIYISTMDGSEEQRITNNPQADHAYPQWGYIQTSIFESLPMAPVRPDMMINVPPVITEDYRGGYNTQLFQNFPNPFNPETWIPYQLAEDADVRVTISDATGQLVRTIPVGHKPAAVYESKAKAIYWDGRNENGERVASGVYFYQLTANNELSALRKMLILK